MEPNRELRKRSLHVYKTARGNIWHCRSPGKGQCFQEMVTGELAIHGEIKLTPTSIIKQNQFYINELIVESKL
jgi:hypothetical protein